MRMTSKQIEETILGLVDAVETLKSATGNVPTEKINDIEKQVETLTNMQKNVEVEETNEAISIGEMVKSFIEKKGYNAETLAGQKMALSTKTLLGSTITNENFGTLANPEVIDELMEIERIFRPVPAKSLTVSGQIFSNKTKVTVDNQPLAECVQAPACDKDFSQVTYKIKKYGCQTKSSIEFLTFLEGGIDEVLRQVVIGLRNQLAYDFFNKELADQQGMKNQSANGFKFPATELTTAGVITADDFMRLGSKSKQVMNNGIYFLPLSQYVNVCLLKDNDGQYIFKTQTNLTSGMLSLGTINGHRVVFVEDYVWYKIGANASTSGEVQAAYVAPEAMRRFTATMDNYKQLFSDVKQMENVIVVFDRDPAAPGCFFITALTYHGHGIIYDTMGELLVNKTV